MTNYIKHDTKMADMIRNFRQQRGISRAELAELVGVSEAHISKIETGIKSLVLIHMRKSCMFSMQI